MLGPQTFCCMWVESSLQGEPFFCLHTGTSCLSHMQTPSDLLEVWHPCGIQKELVSGVWKAIHLIVFWRLMFRSLWCFYPFVPGPVFHSPFSRQVLAGQELDTFSGLLWALGFLPDLHICFQSSPPYSSKSVLINSLYQHSTPRPIINRVIENGVYKSSSLRLREKRICTVQIAVTKTYHIHFSVEYFQFPVPSSCWRIPWAYREALPGLLNCP